MNKKIILGLCTVIIAVFFSSCSRKIYFSTEVKNRVLATNTPLTKLQYYVDRDVELKRVITTGETKVSSGTIKVENGKSVQIIRLKKNTPGVCTGESGNNMLVSFEEGNNKNLVFAFPKNGTVKNAYVLQVNAIDKNNVASINYDGKTYVVASKGVYAKLKVKKSVATKLKVKKSKMKGRKV